MANSVSRTLIIAEAQRRGWKVEFIGPQEYICKVTNLEGQSEMFLSSRPLRSSANGTAITIRKHITLDYVQSHGYRVPAYTTLNDDSETGRDFLEQYKTIVVKPSDAQQSAGVTMHVTTPQQLAEAVAYARGHGRSPTVILQEQIEGNLYRIFVINGKLVAAAHRRAAMVIGDGQHSIRELVDRLNQDPRRGTDNSTPLKQIKGTDVRAFLGEEHLADVPPAGAEVRVSAIDSVSAGGESADVTASVHPDWHQACGELAQGIGLFVCGYDIICPDISQPLQDKYLPLLEMNSAPGLKLHHYPTAGGEVIDVAKILLDEVFQA